MKYKVSKTMFIIHLYDFTIYVIVYLNKLEIFYYLQLLKVINKYLNKFLTLFHSTTQRN